jgi:uncharacterized cupin superfamily protein
VWRVSVAKVNIVGVELDERLDEAGFRHLAATVGGRLGARRIGASVYWAEEGLPIWPYHYHHGIEEWLYVIAGAPELREPAGERALSPGDVVCFPTGHLGAHTLSGPGRFVIFATGQHVEPWLSVYPDSGKVSGPEGILLRSSAVGYGHGEGTAGSQAPDQMACDAESPSPRPVVNVSALPAGLHDPHAPAGSRYRATEVAPLLGADRLAGTVVEVDPGEGAEPYHYVHGREAWLVVLDGAPRLRHPHGEARLDEGDLVCLPEGPAGARRLLNRGESVVRALFLSTTSLPVSVCYPDTGTWLIQNGHGLGDTVLVEAARSE